jgi:hypothetical protein
VGGWNIRREISDFAFELTGDDRGLEEFALQLYSGEDGARGHQDNDDPQGPVRSYRLSKRQDSYVFSEGNTELCQSSDLASFFRKAEWAITKAAMEGLDRFFQVHAGVVASACTVPQKLDRWLSETLRQPSLIQRG